MKQLSRKGSQILPSSTLEIDALFKQMKASGIPVIGFGAGEPDFDTPESIRNAGKSAIDLGFTRYTPVSGLLDLRAAVCRKLAQDQRLHYAPDQIVVSGGAKQCLFNALFAILDEGDEVIIPSPYWISYPEMVRMCGAVPVFAETGAGGRFKMAASQLDALVTPRTKAIILNSPCNPTGAVYTVQELQQIASVVRRHDLYVLSDEIYEKLAYAAEPSSIAALDADMQARTILVNGVSKSYAMTGWRIGYSASTPLLARVMNNIQGHMTSNSSAIGQVAAIEALNGRQESIDTMRQAFKERRDYMVSRINAMPLVHCEPPDGAFYIMMDVRRLIGLEKDGLRIDSSDVLCRCLLEQARIALVPGSGFGIEGFVRLSFTTSLEQIVQGMDRLEAFIRQWTAP